MKEIWVDIIGFEGKYQVSNLGRVKSLSRYVPSPHPNAKRTQRLIQERILKSNPNSDGYLTLNLCGKGYRVNKVHRLVAMHFLSNPENKPQINHIDGVKANNVVSNLEWVTNGENQKHAWSTGLNTGTKGRSLAPRPADVRAKLSRVKKAQFKSGTSGITQDKYGRFIKSTISQS